LARPLSSEAERRFQLGTRSRLRPGTHP
jgi:hypothetical protein